jgi:hypothetical protein
MELSDEFLFTKLCDVDLHWQSLVDGASDHTRTYYDANDRDSAPDIGKRSTAVGMVGI